MIIILDRKITPKEFKMALESYDDYIKTVVDSERNVLAVGGTYHIDCEEVLIKDGSAIKNLFGGGYRVSTDKVTQKYLAP